MKFYWELNKAAYRVLEAVALGLSLNAADKKYLFDLHSGHNNQLRLLHYPPISAESLREQVVARMPAHCDWRYVLLPYLHYCLIRPNVPLSTFTMLFQDSCGGLEFEDPSHPGSFIPAAPVAGALALNVGDMLQRLSNGPLTLPN